MIPPASHCSTVFRDRTTVQPSTETGRNEFGLLTVRRLTPMKSKSTFKLIAVILAAVCAIILLFVFGYVGDSVTRVKREHGVQIPPSASHFVCRGDAWIPFLDRVAVSTFEMARTDVGSFTNQFRVKTSDALSAAFASDDEGSFATYYCDSPTGDFLFVRLWKIDDSRVRVRLYTDWN